MFLFLIIFFIVYVISFVFFYYKLKLQDDELEQLYSDLYNHIEQDFRKEGKKNA